MYHLPLSLSISASLLVSALTVGEIAAGVYANASEPLVPALSAVSFVQYDKQPLLNPNAEGSLPESSAVLQKRKDDVVQDVKLKAEVYFQLLASEIIQRQEEDEQIPKPSTEWAPLDNLSPISNGPLKNGLAFVKPMKVGGSTWSGVMRRIGVEVGLARVRSCDRWLEDEKLGLDPPSVWANHLPMGQLKPVLDEHMPGAYLVTVLRHPGARCLSAMMYFTQLENSEANRVDFIKHQCDTSNMNDYITLQKNKKHTPGTSVDDILKMYDFIGITDRFDESLVVLAKKLNVRLSTMLYVKSKSEENYGKTRRRDHLPFSQETEAVKLAFEETFQNATDMKLFVAANERLDALIADYGTSFQHDLAKFQHMNAEVANVCQSHMQDECFCVDYGCAQQCIFDLVVKRGWGWH